MLYVGSVGQRVGWMFGAVEHLRIEAFPPLIFAVGFGDATVVGHAGHRPLLIGAVRSLEPPPVAPLVHSHAETQSLAACRGGPLSHYIAMRPVILCIPRLVFRVPCVESIMMIGQRNKKPRPGILVVLDHRLGFPIKQRPLRGQVLVSEPRGMAV